MGKEIYNLAAIAHAKKRKQKAVNKLWKKGVEVAYRPGLKSDFYLTREWKKLRWRVLVASDGKCCMCGASKATGAQMHVDHKQPRSKRPDLELDFSNMQVLCADCNLGKGSTSWTPQGNNPGDRQSPVHRKRVRSQTSPTPEVGATETH